MGATSRQASSSARPEKNRGEVEEASDALLAAQEARQQIDAQLADAREALARASVKVWHDVGLVTLRRVMSVLRR
jgi:hypothetical protein